MTSQASKSAPAPHARARTSVGVAALWTVLLIVVLYLGEKLARLPFAPFDVFDGISRLLPGAVVTFGIDRMVGLIRALNLGETAEAAKAAEQTLAIGTFFVIGTIAGALIYAAVRPPRDVGYASGLAGGLLLGVAAAIVAVALGRAPAHGVLWTLAACAAWGAALAWSALRLWPRAGAEPRVERVDRRRFLIRLGGATVAFTVVGAVVGRMGRRAGAPRGIPWSQQHPLPNAAATVHPVPGTRPELTQVADHYRVDINTMVPRLDAEAWRLKTGGLVDQPREFTLDQLRAYPPLHQLITLSCVSNPVGGDLIGTTRWTGVSLQRLLPDLGLAPSATHLKLRSADGFHEVVALDEIRADPRIMLAYAWDGLPLTAEHGAPLRVYLPDRYGMKQPKWIVRIEALDHWEPGYWVERGWDREARMKTTSVIDTVDVGGMRRDARGVAYVPVGGIAHAGDRGISRVEVRVDDGPWTQAALRTPLSGLTWVIWRAELPVERGHHVFTVRCVDGTGAPQSTEVAPPHPSGASGLDTKRQTV